MSYACAWRRATLSSCSCWSCRSCCPSRGVVAVLAGDFGTFDRQLGVLGVVLVFGAALYRRWDDLEWAGGEHY